VGGVEVEVDKDMGRDAFSVRVSGEEEIGQKTKRVYSWVF